MIISTQINIAASTEVVWAKLTEFESYPLWNPFITSVEGEVTLNSKIAIALPQMRFKPTVTAYIPGRELQWTGSLAVRGLFDGTHRFAVEALEDGTTLFTHSESFSGLLVPLFRKSLNTQTRSGFEAMNRALKKLVEDSKSL